MNPDFPIDTCKDVAFARNLIASMKEGYGRHNSNTFNRRPPGLPIHSEGRDLSRCVGLFGAGQIKTNPQHCNIGDAVPDSHFPCNDSSTFFELPMAPLPCLGFFTDFDTDPVPVPTLLFERVRITMTSGNGHFRDEIFWKRIE